MWYKMFLPCPSSVLVPGLAWGLASNRPLLVALQHHVLWSLAGTQRTCRIFIAHLPHCSHRPSTAEVSAVRWEQDSSRPTGSELLMLP